MGAKDYMPTSDGGFDVFQSNFLAGVSPNLAAWGIPTTDFTTLVSYGTVWSLRFNLMRAEALIYPVWRIAEARFQIVQVADSVKGFDKSNPYN